MSKTAPTSSVLAETSPRAPINVYTEWGKLEEVILGNCRQFNHAGIDSSFRFLYDNRDGKFHERDMTPRIDQRYIDERQEDLDNLEELLKKEGVTVRRPKRLAAVTPIVTPNFASSTTASDSPRDMFFAYGHTMYESPPTNRKRFFEQYLLRDIFREYFDRGAGWVSAPKPMLSDESIDYSYWKDNLDKGIPEPQDTSPALDIAFDAANALKFGKDIVFNIGTDNHALGFHWLKRVLPSEVRVHPIRLSDSHIDGHFIPIAPGKLLCNEVVMHNNYDCLPKELQKWDRIPILDPATNFDYPSDHLQMASSVGMSVNILSLDEERILIRDNAQLTIRALSKAGLTPIPVRLRHSELFGGGIHCSTVDVRRTEDMEDYFS
jgi:glycine amidinotransferase